MQNEKPADVLLMVAGSLWTLFLHYAAVLWAWLPGGLTVTYVVIRIYYKIKHERAFWREKHIRDQWEKADMPPFDDD